MVLKPRLEKVSLDETARNLLNSNIKKGQTTIERISQSIQEESNVSNNAACSMRYDVKFQNQAIENILGFEDIQKNLFTPSLMVSNRIQTLHQMTTKKSADLS